MVSPGTYPAGYFVGEQKEIVGKQMFLGYTGEYIDCNNYNLVSNPFERAATPFLVISKNIYRRNNER